MLTYQVRPRIFRLRSERALEWPAKCVLRLHFAPDQPFGVSAGGGRTAVIDQAASMLFNANTGQHFVTSKAPLTPLEVHIEWPNRILALDGTTLELQESVDSIDQLNEMVMGLFFALPPLLNVGFGDPPTIESVDGLIGEVPFRWELAQWNAQIHLTSQEKQETVVVKTWDRLSLVSGPSGRRLLAALHYFHTAVRLDRASAAVGEFMTEAVLNLAKCLEVLFPPVEKEKTRDAVRAGLRRVGYGNLEIERLFIPAMALRNEIDVGHVSLALLTSSQLRAIHAYTEVAEPGFRQLLERVLEQVEAGTLVIPPYVDSAPSAGARRVLDQLESTFRAPSDAPLSTNDVVAP